MSKSNFKLILIFLFTISIATNLYCQTVDDITFVTESYPPFNFEENGVLQGISVDLLVEIFQRVDSKQTRSSLKLYPWARSYINTLENKNTALFSMTRTEEREDLFKWVGPISNTTISIMARKDKNIKIDTIEDINKYSVNVVRYGVSEQLLVNMGIRLESLERVGGTDIIFRAIQKLNIDRVDLFPYEQNVFNWSLKLNGLDPNEYESVFLLKEGAIYFAFNIETPDSLIAEFQNVLDGLKSDGTYEEITSRYLIK